MFSYITDMIGRTKLIVLTLFIASLTVVTAVATTANSLLNHAVYGQCTGGAKNNTAGSIATVAKEAAKNATSLR
jgi:hypothetical protein